jgi:hypothetical protein
MRFGGIVLLAMLAVGACSSDPEPKEPKPSTTSATPTATAPTMPAQAKEDTPSGAATYVQYFVDTFNYAAQTGDVGLMRAAAPRCKPCNAYADDFQSQKAAGGLAESPVWTLSDVAIGASRRPIEIDATVAVLDDDGSPYKLTFVLNEGAPFELRNIYDRGK